MSDIYSFDEFSYDRDFEFRSLIGEMNWLNACMAWVSLARPHQRQGLETIPDRRQELSVNHFPILLPCDNDDILPKQP